MPLIKKTQRPATALLNEALKAKTRNNQISVLSDRVPGLLALESLTEGSENSQKVDEIELATSTDVADAVEDAVDAGGDGVSMESFEAMIGKKDSTQRNNALEAAVIARIAGMAPSAYAKEAYSNDIGYTGGDRLVEDIINRSGAYSVQMATTPAMESFDDSQLVATKDESITYNLAVVQQQEAADLLFKTKVISTDQAAYAMSIPRRQIYNAVARKTKGQVVDWKKRELIEAQLDPTILENNATKLIPSADISDAATYLSPNVTFTTKLAGKDVNTAGVLFGVSYDLLTISNDPGLLSAQVYDHTDGIAPAVSLKTVYVKVSNATTTEVIPFDVTNMPGVDFQAPRQGDQNYLDLFANLKLKFPAAPVTVAGAASTVLAPITATYAVSLNVRIAGRLNLQTGEITEGGLSYANSLGPVITRSTKVELSPTDATYTSLFSPLTFSGDSYFLDAYRTNANLRALGQILDTNRYTERYPIRLHPAIHTQSPIAADKTGMQLDGLIAAARTTASNDAISTALNYVDRLKSVYTNAVEDNTLAIGMEDVGLGMGRFLVRPFYTEAEIDVSSALNSTSSGERYGDIRGLVVNVLREVFSRMIAESGYQAGLEQMVGPGAKPSASIVAHTYLQQYVQLAGDDRLLGDRVTAKVATTPIDTMKDTILMTMNCNECDALNSGLYVYMPELIYTTQVSRGNGNTVMESGVQPRYRHIPVLPVWAKITITGLQSAAEAPTKYVLSSESTTTP